MDNDSHLKIVQKSIVRVPFIKQVDCFKLKFEKKKKIF